MPRGHEGGTKLWYRHFLLNNYKTSSAGLQPAVEMETDTKGLEILMKKARVLAQGCGFTKALVEAHQRDCVLPVVV